MTELVLRDYEMFTLKELNFLLCDTLKVLGNSISFDPTVAMNRKPQHRDETTGYGFMPALEILYGQTTVNLYCSKPDALERALDRCCSHNHKEMFNSS